MTRSEAIRAQHLRRMGSHVLAHGLNTASLRPLAQAAGTSDRMLIYHFKSKESLISELLGFLANDLQDKLDGAMPSRRARTRTGYVKTIIALLRREPFNRYMRVWFDIVSAASQGSEAHRAIGRKMIAGYLSWLEKRLPAGDPDPAASLAVIFTIIEGVLVMDAVGQSELADRAVESAFRS